MIVDSQILTFAGIALVLTLTPGADTMIVIRNVMDGKKRAGVMTTLGICAGLLVHAFFSAVGLSVILLNSAKLFEIVKLLGAAYLVFLGIQSLLKAIKFGRLKSVNDLINQQTSIQHKSSRKYFFNGMFTNILNPKVALFYLALLPQFINPGDPVLITSVLLGSIHLLFGLIWLTVLTLLVTKLRILFNNSKFRAMMESLSGAVLIGLGIKLALEKR